jgi:hypothetical protein
MSYTLNLELFCKQTGELFSKVTVDGLKGHDLKSFPILNPDPSSTIIKYQVSGPSDSDTITKYQSIPWEGFKDDINEDTIKKTNHEVIVYLYNEDNVLCDKTSNNSGDAILEPEG